MIDLLTIERYCDNLLETAKYEDYCPNGLQVEAGEQVRKLMVGVTACQALIDEATTWGADLLLVHHGYFWKGEPAPIRGLKGRRVASLLRNRISLLAYHLPLDAHPELGNNRCLAEVCGFPLPEVTSAGRGLVWQSTLTEAIPADVLSVRLGDCLGRDLLHIHGRRERIERIGWCTGAAQGFLEEAAELGLDAYLSGEISESTVHVARELDINYFAAGHHATERYGVRALGEHLAQVMAIEHLHIDIDNPA